MARTKSMDNSNRDNRISISLSDEMHDWILKESEILGLPLATSIIVLLNELKRLREERNRNLEMSNQLMNSMQDVFSKNPQELFEMIGMLSTHPIKNSVLLELNNLKNEKKGGE